MDAKQLYEQGLDLFQKRTSLMMFYQEVSEHFYPERADFTFHRSLGNEFAENMMTSYPMLVRRDLQDQVGQMLRPTNKEYARIGLKGGRRVGNEAQRYLDWFARTQRRAMYDRRTQFVETEKLNDGDFATFGNNVCQARLNRTRDRLIYLNWHLRDVVWMHNAEREICGVWRKELVQARDMVAIFPTTVHQHVRDKLTATKPEPFATTECMHMMVQADMYDGKSKGLEWWSVWYDCEHQSLLEAVPMFENEYIIGRWVKPGVSQYAYSPAVVCGLPDGRLLQAMTHTLVEVGEKVANPPMIAVNDAVTSAINVYAGGVTWASQDYDERTGEVLRPINVDSKGIPYSMDMLRDTRGQLREAFYLNKLTLPQRTGDVTAYEISQRVQEYIRQALPLFEPMEYERNGAMWEHTFHLLRRAGAFGSELDWPKELRAEDIEFTFESPLHDAIEQVRGQQFLEVGQYVAAGSQLDPTVAQMLDVKEAFRDVLAGRRVPATWVRSELEVQQAEEADKQQQAAAQQLAAMQQGSEVVGNLAAAQRDNAQASMVPA